MRFVLFGEGLTERYNLPQFFKRWLDPRLSRKVSVKSIFVGHGAARYREEIVAFAKRTLDQEDVIGIGLLDLYRLENVLSFPTGVTSVDDRCAWAKSVIERTVGLKNFHQFFAVQETEAWLLSQPEIFRDEVQRDISRISAAPEQIASEISPAEFLGKIYRERVHQSYKKTLDGAALFAKLEPERAYDRCPHLRTILDTMLDRARKAGL